ncbi:hypothetical protein Tco_0878653 [Tanacetum coccineum]|uniref:Uncharacterized protein n=1 Tax=Tanacetum coccineum TaxID=301880 RepID=A0ABQ5C1R8_9ASTR
MVNTNQQPPPPSSTSTMAHDDIEVVCVEFGCHFEVELECELTLSSLDVLHGFSFFLQMGFTLILATFDGLDVGLLGDVIGEDDCNDDG